MLGDTIKRMRQEQNLSQEELAAKLYVVRQTVSKWERNLSVPDVRMLENLAEVFDVTTSLLLGDTERQEQNSLEMADFLTELRRELEGRKNRRNRRKKMFLASIAILAVIWSGIITVDFMRLHGSTDYQKKPLFCISFTQTVDQMAHYNGLGYSVTYDLDGLDVAGVSFRIFGLEVYRR